MTDRMVDGKELDLAKDRLWKLGKPYWYVEEPYTARSRFGSGPVPIPRRYYVCWWGLAPNGMPITEHGDTLHQAISEMKHHIQEMLKRSLEGSELRENYQYILDNWHDIITAMPQKYRGY